MKPMMAAIRYRFVSMLVLAMTLPLAMAVMAFAESGSHGDGHAEMHEHYNMWIDNRGFGCCDNRDCRPVHADATPEGWRVWIDGQWVRVPPDAVLHIPSPDGRSHVCMAAGAVEPRCFVPGEPRS